MNYSFPGYGSVTLEKPSLLTDALKNVNPLDVSTFASILPSVAGMIPFVGPVAGPIVSGILSAFGSGSGPTIEEATFQAISQVSQQITEGFNNLSNLVVEATTQIIDTIKTLEQQKAEIQAQLTDYVNNKAQVVQSQIASIRAQAFSAVDSEIASRQSQLKVIKNNALNLMAQNYKAVTDYSYSVLVKGYYKAGLQQAAEELQEKQKKVDNILLIQKKRKTWFEILLRLEELIPPLIEKIRLAQGYKKIA